MYKAFILAILCATQSVQADAADSVRGVPVKILAPFKKPFDVRSFDLYAEPAALHLLMATRIPERPGADQLYYLRSENGGANWSRPVILDSDGGLPAAARRGNDVQIVGHGSRLLALWPAPGALPGIGKLAMAYSVNRGRTWKPGPSPVNTDREVDQGYAEAVAAADGGFHVVWLDDRDERGNAQGLRYARAAGVTPTWVGHATLVDATCTCCWNAMAVEPNGALDVLFRQHEPHDMGLIRSPDAGRTWLRARTVGAFNWVFVGCPHKGGGLAVAYDRGTLFHHSIVWTGKESQPGLYYLRSRDGGRTWPVQTFLADPSAMHADIAAGARQELGAAWDRVDGDGSTIVAVQSKDAGATWSKPRVLSSSSSQAHHPRIIATAAGLRVFWSQREQGETETIVMANLNSENES